MKFNVVFITTALLASGSLVMSARIDFFAGANCTSQVGGKNAVSGTCLTLGSGSVRSVGYSDVPNRIDFYISGGGHDSCTNGANTSLGGGSGCLNAPAG